MARYTLPGKGPLRLFLLLTQMTSPVVLIIGIFRMMSALRLINDHLSLILAYSGFSVAFAVWMLQSYFETIPREIEEAAYIDGASWWVSLRRIFLPLALPAIGVTAIFTFIAAWTDFILAFTLSAHAGEADRDDEALLSRQRHLSRRLERGHGGDIGDDGAGRDRIPAAAEAHRRWVGPRCRQVAPEPRQAGSRMTRPFRSQDG